METPKKKEKTENLMILKVSKNLDDQPASRTSVVGKCSGHCGGGGCHPR